MQLSTLFVKELKHLCHSVVSYFDKGGLNLIFNAHAFVLKKGSVYNCVLRGIHTLHNFLFAKSDDNWVLFEYVFRPCLADLQLKCQMSGSKFDICTVRNRCVGLNECVVSRQQMMMMQSQICHVGWKKVLKRTRFSTHLFQTFIEYVCII